MSIEGGMKGYQKRFVCEKCGKVFFSWRPETAPGVKVKCYFCKHEFEDEAAKRVREPQPSQPRDANPPETPPASPPESNG